MTVAATDLENRVNKNVRPPLGSLSGDDSESRIIPHRGMLLDNPGDPEPRAIDKHEPDSLDRWRHGRRRIRGYRDGGDQRAAARRAHRHEVPPEEGADP